MNIKLIVSVAMVCLLSACAAHDPVIDQNLKTLPREIAVDYLQTEAGIFSDSDNCIYTNLGIEGIPYSELEYEVIGSMPYSFVVVWKKGTRVAIAFHGDERVVCKPLFYNIWNEHPYTDEEYREAFNKICSALEALGTRRVY